MDALKSSYHYILFLLVLGLLAWSAYAVFTKMGAVTAPDLSASAGKKVPELPIDEYNGYMAKLSDRYAMDMPTNVVMTSEERFRCSHCSKLTRYYHNVENIVCSHCGEKVNPDLPDRDGDGFPNEYEEEHGLDPNDPNDVITDKDGDFFWNVTEYNADPETSPSDPASHPPYTPFLYLTNIVNEPVRMLFQSKSKIGPEKFSFMLRLPGNKTKIVKKGQDLGPYLIEDFEEVIEPSKRVKGPDGRMRDVPKRDRSVLKVKKKSNGRVFDLVLGARKLESDWGAEVRSHLEPEFSAKIDEFGNNKFQYRDEAYEILRLSTDGAKVNRLSKEEGAGGDESIIGTSPAQYDPNAVEPAGFDGGGEFDNPDGFPGGYPPGYVPPAPSRRGTTTRPGSAPRIEYPPGYFGPGSAPANPGAAYPGGIPPAPRPRVRTPNRQSAPSSNEEVRRQTEEFNRLKRSGGLGR